MFLNLFGHRLVLHFKDIFELHFLFQPHFFLLLQVKEGLVETQKTLKVGDVQDFSSFMSAVIDKKAFDRISGYIDHAKSSPNTKIVAGGTYDESVGYFIQPTVVETSSKDDRIFKEEIFGPVVTAYVYPDSQAKNIVDHIGKDTPYALTGALYSQDQ